MNPQLTCTPDLDSATAANLVAIRERINGQTAAMTQVADKLASFVIQVHGPFTPADAAPDKCVPCDEKCCGELGVIHNAIDYLVAAVARSTELAKSI